MAGGVKAGELEARARRLRFLQAWETGTARLLGGWLPGIVRWEYKHAVARHLWEDAEHARELRTRLWELRVANPDRGVTERVLPALRALAAAQHDDELLAGVYLALKPALVAAYTAYIAATHDVYDGPTLPVLRRILAEEEAQIAWAREVVAAMADSGEKRRRVMRWQRYAGEVIAAVGGVDGAGLTTDAATDGDTMSALPPLPEPPPGHTSSPLPFPEARRDERFRMQAGGMALPAPDDRLGQVLFQFSNYTMEMQAAETLGSTLWEADDMPWEFSHDVARHCYDEARHAALGEARLGELGYHVTDFPHWTGNYAWRQLLDPMRRYCVLTAVIEAGSFPYKHETYAAHLAAGDAESAQAVLYDITDETMHVRFGTKWVPEMMKRAGYTGTFAQLTEECREITARNTLAPMQRDAAAGGRGMKRDGAAATTTVAAE